MAERHDALDSKTHLHARQHSIFWGSKMESSFWGGYFLYLHGFRADVSFALGCEDGLGGEAYIHGEAVYVALMNHGC